MVVESIRSGGFFPQQSTEEWPESLTAARLLEKGEYEQLIEMLQVTRRKAERSGDSVLAGVLAAAHQLCLTCSHYHMEVESQAEAYEAAVNRERVFRQQLQQILALIDGQDALKATDKRIVSMGRPVANPGLRPHDHSQFENRNLWQRIQGFWERIPGVPSLEQEFPATTFEDPRSTITSLATAAGSTEAFLEQQNDDASEEAFSSVKASLSADRKGPTLSVYCFGSFRVFDNGHLVDSWNGNKGKAIFKYLVNHREQPIHREILMDLFWPDEEPEVARRNLYQAIYMMRQTLQSSATTDLAHVLCEDSCYGFNPEIELWVDSEAFERHYQTGLKLESEDRMREAIGEYEAADTLYEGEFLAEDIYEEWTLIQRENLKHAHLDILDRLSQHYWTQKQFSLCVTYCQKILYKDSCREDAHRRLMLAYLRRGQRHLALRQYHRCVEALQQELDVAPMPATVELYQKIQNNQVQFSDL